MDNTQQNVNYILFWNVVCKSQIRNMLRYVWTVKFVLQILFKLDLSNCFKHTFDSLKHVIKHVWLVHQMLEGSGSGIGFWKVKFVFEAGIQEKFEANLKETFYCVLKYTVLAVYVNHIWLWHWNNAFLFWIFKENR